AFRLVLACGRAAGRGWDGGWAERLRPPAGLALHWSRLVGGGLAAVYSLFALFLAADGAETAVRLVWPLLWIFPLALGAALTARRLGGAAAVLAAAIFVACLPVLVQFAAGRIDHHNVQMALALLMLAGATNIEARWGAWLAGVSTGLLIAVGL